MTIKELNDTSFEQECNACEAVQTINFSDISVGVARGDQLDGAVIPLSPCQSCNAREFLIRSPIGGPDHPSPGSYGHLHRLLVDTLHARLVGEGRLSDGFTTDDPPPTKEADAAELDQWFPQGFTLERRAEQGAP